MAGIFGGSKGQGATRYQFLNVQTSSQGLVIPIGWGTFRASPNLLWYGDFVSVAAKQKTGKGGPTVSSYDYSVALIWGLCEGPIESIGQVWQDKTLYTLEDTGFTLFTGSQTQAPWSYLETKHPTQALAYAGTAYLANGSCQLGTSPDLPNYNFEVFGTYSGTFPENIYDANIADILGDYLTNPQYGIGFPTDAIDSTSLAFLKTYNQAQNLHFSPYMDQQEQGTQTFQRWAQLANAWFFWSGSVLKFVPLGDSAITANGVTYTPNLSPVYALTYDDFVFKKGTDPVIVTRSDPADGYNNVTIDCNDRANGYNNTSIYWQDNSSVALYGQLMSQTISANEINALSVASICATLIGQRSVYVRNTYEFNLGYNFVLLEPGDIVTITDPNIGLAAFPVRIQSISESKDGTLKVTAEELPAGIGTPAAYSNQTWSGNSPVDVNVAPGSVNTPAIFEPSAALTSGIPEVWVGVSGGVDWGGADVYLSFTGDNYDYIGTAQASIQGTLTAALALHADPDTTNTLAVDLTESNSTLPATATDADADAGRTLIIVDGEVMAYGSAVPATGTNPFAFDLSYLRRGQYGTAPAAHSIGANFTRVNPQTIFTYQLPAAYVGATLYLKFVSFNVFGNAYQDIADVGEYTYVPVGTGYHIAAPGVPTVTPSSTTQSDGTTFLSLTVAWSASAGPNLGSYLVQFSTNGGTTWQNAANVGPGVTTYTLTPALASTNYLFRVQAISQNGLALSSQSVSASTNSGSLVTSVPAAPTGITATAGAGSAVIEWVPSASASTKGYQVSYGTSSSFGSASLYPITTSGSGISVTGLTPGTEYYFWVQAFNGAGASSPDGPANATPSAASGATYQFGSIDASGVLTISSGLTMSGTANPTIALAMGGYEGTDSLGAFAALNAGPGLAATIESDTIVLLATGLTFVNGTTTVGSSLEMFSGTGLDFIEGSAGITINLSDTVGGGIIIGGTSYGTMVAGTGTTFTPGTGSLSGEITLSTAGSGSASGVMTLTDGSITLSSTVLNVNNLDLSALSSTAPSIVQSNFVHGSGSIALSSASTSGNLIILIFGHPSDASAPAISGWTLQADGGPNYTRVAIYSKAASGTTESVNPSDDNVYSSMGIFEISGCSSAVYGSEAMTNTAGVLTASLAAIGSTASLVLFGISNVANPLSGSYSAPMPSGSTIINQGDAGPDYVNCMAYIKSPTLESVDSPVIGASFASPANPWVGYVVLVGESGSGMEITPTIPTSINGTAVGGFQAMEINTGASISSASLSSGTLVINLGTP